MTFLYAGGHRLEYAWFGDAADRRPAVVMLHEGLGCIAMWRDFPQRVAAATGRRVLAYSRYGYGQSDVLGAPRQPDFMHVEALHTLPDLLDQLDVEAPVLLGHSDGGSIALIHAASARPLSAVVVMAPHVKVEELSVRSIAAAGQAYQTTDLPQRLGRYHQDADATFHGWNDIWLLPAFRDWNIEALLPQIRCPVLAIQGEEDEYGTMEQVDSIARHAADVRLLKLPRCGHSPHRDQPEAVLQALGTFLV